MMATPIVGSCVIALVAIEQKQTTAFAFPVCSGRAEYAGRGRV
ncbi:hypothetical protein [Mesorhizobium sp. M0437]